MENDRANYEQAIEAILQTLRQKPDLVIARYDLAMLYLKVGDRGSAIFQYGQLKKYDEFIAQKLLEQIFHKPGQEGTLG